MCSEEVQKESVLVQPMFLISSSFRNCRWAVAGPSFHSHHDVFVGACISTEQRGTFFVPSSYGPSCAHCLSQLKESFQRNSWCAMWDCRGCLDTHATVGSGTTSQTWGRQSCSRQEAQVVRERPGRRTLSHRSELDCLYPRLSKTEDVL